MKKILFLLFWVLISTCHTSSATEIRRFEITITDFFFPLLSNEQNQALPEQFLNDQLTIAGSYISKKYIENLSYNSLEKDVGYPCYWDCAPLSHQTKTTRKHIVQRQQAKIISLDPQNRKVIFELPSELDNGFLLDTIYYSFPITPLWGQPSIPKTKNQREREKRFMELHIPVTLDSTRAHFNHYQLEPQLSYAVSNTPYSARIRIEDPHDFEAHLGMVIQINLLDKDNTPLATPLLPDFKARLPQEKNTSMIGDIDSIRIFGPTDAATYSNAKREGLLQSISFDNSRFTEENLLPITLPKNTPVWQNAKNVKGQLINLGHIKIIKLQGELTYELGEGEYKTNKSYFIKEIWTMAGDQVIKIHGIPDKNSTFPDQCYFAYGITPSLDNTKQLYFTRDNRYEYPFSSPLADNDAAPLLDFERRKKEMTFKMPHAIKACLQKIDNTKRLFNKTQKELEKDFTIYQKAIEHAQKQTKQP